MQGIVRRLAVLLMALPLFTSAAHAAPRWDNPLPQGNIIADVVWNGSRYVAVGNAGTVLVSDDGGQWQSVPSGTTAWLEAIRWNETQRQFIVSGNGGTLLTSADGLQWTRQASGADGYLYGVASAGSLNVVVGSSGVVITSNDGIHWSSRDSGVVDWLNDVAWNGLEFIAVGGNGTIIASADGIHWARRDSPIRTADAGPSIESIAWSAELRRWVAVTEIGAGPEGSAPYALWSDDGLLWNARAAGPQPLRGLVWDAAQGRFVATGGNGQVLVSADGMAWGAPNGTGYGESIESVVVGGGGLVAVGEHGLILSAVDPAGAWTRRSSGPLAAMTSVAFDGTGYAAVGDRIILHRADLSASTTLDVIDRAGGAPLPLLRGVAWGAGDYVAAGQGGVILRSADGITWVSDGTVGVNLNGVTHAADGTWYAVGAEGRVLRNSGRGWSVARSGRENLNGVAADSAGLVAVGSQGTRGVVLTSADGAHWSATTFSNIELRGVASGNGRRVAVGSGGTVLTDAGSGWTVRNVGTTSALNGVIWDGRRFVAVGRDGSSFASGDGVHWSRQSVTGNDLSGIAAAAGHSFIVAGEGGTVIRSVCPCATDDYAVGRQDQPLTIPVLANDSGGNLVVVSVDSRTTRRGSVTANGDGTVTYTPAAGFVGTDTFSYTAGSSADPSVTDTATVIVTVNGRSSTPDNGGGSGATGGSGGGGAILSLLLPLVWAMGRRRSARA